MTIICALAAILIWSSLASLSVSLAGVPPLMLIGCSLLIGGMLSVPWKRHWNLNWKTISVGCSGMLLYHLLFILALRNAPPVNANIVHYSWPMLIVLLSPIVLKKFRLEAVHWICALIGFGGAGLAIASASTTGLFQWESGYFFAFAAALVWSTYSLMLKRMANSSTADVGLACLLSGGIAIGLHFLFEPTPTLQPMQFLQIALLGLGSMGVAFYLWAYALKSGDPRVIGVMANATPLISSALLVANGYGSFSWPLVFSAVLVSTASLFVVLRIPSKSPQLQED
ncbi:Permease of the drug/metabolite transporter (DMT) superfamily [Collimonas sp. OK307]|uniref:DMT family transporter n=1 Tax=Collimonas sp. OK307 TaxID=1801620 RepID=UPI0008EC8379|nr:DMT family transporter [Collimonas sp. OK307]SFH72038.1 Permease of the drug/metabolite transporter (DMT) superfamily [Collimonas sp. OK307]